MLIECIPNVSEGRDTKLIERLAQSVRDVPGAALLDYSSDPTHHRSVFTIAGRPAAVEEAVLALAAGAVRAIDLRRHDGAHPRVGALDVVPFVPLTGAAMANCVASAERVAARIGADLEVPVFLYEAAAPVAGRARLERIRAGGLDALEVRMRTDPAWRPDAGPSRLHPTAGAAVVGARRPLLAWNLDLETNDVSVAAAIARAIRESSGGLPGVKAVGIALGHRGVAQVSMNVTDHQATPMHVVYARVAALAQMHGTRIARSEVIGLLPRAALAAARPHVPELWDAHRDRILEDRLGLP